MPASRWALDASCLKRTLAGMLRARSVAPGDDAGLAQAVAELEMLDAGGERRAPVRAGAFGADKIAFDREAAAQGGDGAPLAPGESAPGTTGQPPASTIAA